MGSGACEAQPQPPQAADAGKACVFRLCRNGLRPCPAPAEKRNRKNRPCVYRVLSAVIEVLNKKLFVANAECNGQGFYFIGIEMALTDLDFG